MKIVCSPAHKNNVFKIEQLLKNFEAEGEMLADGGRNQIRIVDLDGNKVAIKSFKIPNTVNKIAYRFFRKSKAQRSFEYATRLLEHGIGTPKPVAYAEQESLLYGKSYYICEFLEYDLTYRELIANSKYVGNADILKAFTAFTYEMHEKGIHFLDHSPGNTLIKIEEDKYRFYLVDLNRMDFKPLDYATRINNFRRLTPKREMVEIMAKEYARLAGLDTNKTVDEMWQNTVEFQEAFQRKKRLKKKIKFWKK
tara:strand:+ start:119381 stop:120136 length:756 start_codon:yes stop_codon:yes gene_type:complete